MEDKKEVIGKIVKDTIENEQEPIPMDLERLLNEILFEVKSSVFAIATNVHLGHYAIKQTCFLYY